VSKGVPAFQRKANRFVADLEDLSLTQVKEASQIVKKNVERLAPRRLRGVGKRGARIGVKYNVGNFGGEPKSFIFAYGPMHFIERKTGEHEIPKRKYRRGKRRVIVIPGIGPRASANHPGSRRPKQPWERGTRASEDDVRNVLQSSTATLIRRHF